MYRLLTFKSPVSCAIVVFNLPYGNSLLSPMRNCIIRLRFVIATPVTILFHFENDTKESFLQKRQQKEKEKRQESGRKTHNRS